MITSNLSNLPSNQYNQPNQLSQIGSVVGYAGYGVNPVRLRALELAAGVNAGQWGSWEVLNAARNFLAFLEGEDTAIGELEPPTPVEEATEPVSQPEQVEQEAEPIAPPLDTQEGEADQVSEAA